MSGTFAVTGRSYRFLDLRIAGAACGRERIPLLSNFDA